MKALSIVLLISALSWTASASDSDEPACPFHDEHQKSMTATANPPSAVMPSAAGEAAFGALGEIVAFLEADPATDWSGVDLDRLRDHLVDMSELVLHAEVVKRELPDGLEIDVRGEGRTLQAVQRMLPAHAAMMRGELSWEIEVAKTDFGARLRLRGDSPEEVAKIRGLGFFGFMASGDHHSRHHLMLATKGNPHH